MVKCSSKWPVVLARDVAKGWLLWLLLLSWGHCRWRNVLPRNVVYVSTYPFGKGCEHDWEHGEVKRRGRSNLVGSAPTSFRSFPIAQSTLLSTSYKILLLFFDGVKLWRSISFRVFFFSCNFLRFLSFFSFFLDAFMPPLFFFIW